MIWTAALGHERCGNCFVVVAKDQPLAFVTNRRLVRCEACAGPADQQAVESVLAERRAAKAEALTNELNKLLKNTGGIKGVRRSKVKPYAEVADDPDVMRTGGGE